MQICAEVKASAINSGPAHLEPVHVVLCADSEPPVLTYLIWQLIFCAENNAAFSVRESDAYLKAAILKSRTTCVRGSGET